MSTLTLANRRYVFGVGLFSYSAKFFAAWIVAAAVFTLVLPIVIAQFGSIEVSAWFHFAQAARIFLAIVAGLFLFSLLPTSVGNGVTRRELAVATGVFGILGSLALAAVAMAGYFAEHVIYRLADWRQGVEFGGDDIRLESVSAVLDVSGRYPLTYLLYFVAGALLGAAIYRSDGGWLLMLPVVPAVLVLDTSLTQAVPWGPGWVQRIADLSQSWSAVVAAGVVLAAVALMAWVAYRILVGTPIRSKQA